MSAQRTQVLRALLAAMSAGVGCGDCEFEVKQIDRFPSGSSEPSVLDRQRCVVETLEGCVEVESAFCGQITLNHQASQSNQWLRIKEDASGCGGSTCWTCAAQRIPTCTDGACMR